MVMVNNVFMCKNGFCKLDDSLGQLQYVIVNKLKVNEI